MSYVSHSQKAIKEAHNGQSYADFASHLFIHTHSRKVETPGARNPSIPEYTLGNQTFNGGLWILM